MTEEDRAGADIPLPANDNGLEQEAVEEVERHLDTIARAIGRHIAREHIRDWERDRRKRAANDNRPKEEGREPDG